MESYPRIRPQFLPEGQTFIVRSSHLPFYLLLLSLRFASASLTPANLDSSRCVDTFTVPDSGLKHVILYFPGDETSVDRASAAAEVKDKGRVVSSLHQAGPSGSGSRSSRPLPDCSTVQSSNDLISQISAFRTDLEYYFAADPNSRTHSAE
ncbi:hypothetical protein DFH27DRAFT_286679 [Peziza echinospora]|nr:hypothetical protein DFH27DRAFT_286679 [Peziza echinospora]